LEWFGAIWGHIQIYLIVVEYFVVIHIGAELLWTQEESIFSCFPYEFMSISLLVD